jgi:hypothetical protein
VQATRSATSLTHDIGGPGVSLVGHVQRVHVDLPEVRIQDTTCDTGDWHFLVSISDFAHVGGRPSHLVPRSVQGPGTGSSDPSIALVDERGTATLVIPRPVGRTSTDLALSAEIEIPAYPAAGDYRATVVVALL